MSVVPWLSASASMPAWSTVDDQAVDDDHRTDSLRPAPACGGNG